MRIRPIVGLLIPVGLSLAWGVSANAQVTPDGTLSTTVSHTDSSFTINNGSRVGNHLFHSFSQFSVPTNGAAIFNNAADVQTIFSRVTGGRVSNIDGLIQTNGTADLFLLNPSGILFGPNASLNIGGSFITSTADSILFEDGTEFETTGQSHPSLLTISTPIGLQLGNQPAPITVQGTGHTLTTSTGISPLMRRSGSSELRVQPGHTLALVGGELRLQGAILTAEQGNIELGSSSNAGLVRLTPIPDGYRLGYDSAQPFGNIQLAQQSLLNVSGVNAGSVSLQGRQIQFADGSLIWSQNLGALPGGTIHLRASESINIVGTTADAAIRSGIRNESLATGAGSAIEIVTPHLSLLQGAGINSNAFGTGSSGDIKVNAATVEIAGSSPINPSGVTSLTTNTRGFQPAGDIYITGERLLVSGGGALSSITFGAGAGGQVTIRNRETTVVGDNFGGLYSNISGITFGTGDAGRVALETQRLRILDGGAIATTSWLVGQGGDLDINATESVLISGQGQSNNSSINSAVIRPDRLIQLLFGLPDVLTADAGSINVTTPSLLITDGGTISVTNRGSGDGGMLAIATDLLYLDRQSSIQAQTTSGEGGNINLQAQNGLIIRNGSLINATAGGAGNGGNITIDAPVIVGLENSDIIANAVEGNGGNIDITTQGIFGLEFRDQLTPENDITASSQFGISGTVQISSIDTDPSSGVIELPANVVDPSQQIATGCAETQGSQFVATGRGGVPQNPTQQINRDRTWEDVRDLSAYRQLENAEPPVLTTTPNLVETTSWRRNANGQIELIAEQSAVPQSAFATCSGSEVSGYSPSHRVATGTATMTSQASW
ncbi:MAG: two-partner secretion domain-containing protein [Thainema sp.]